jgi:DNA-binding helix-hairpin-helix protein with protein kinase domain
MTTSLRVVRDEHGRPLPLIRRIGSGGQAEVCASEGRIAVKLMHARTPRAGARLRSRIGVVRRLSLEGVPVCRPLAMLASPDVGYSMELLEDMVAIERLATVPPGKDLLDWYAETGGLRRRLRLLTRVADAFASLHARGVVYADPSPANVLVSDTPQHEEVRLVDVDFLQSDSVVLETPATPGYAAPELLAGRSGVTNASDAYAFAVIAFEVLTLTHPFLGDEVQHGEPDLLEKAYAGMLPWIDHTEDATNRSSYGLPRERVLTPDLRKLAQQTFRDSLTVTRNRPTIAEWRTALQSAAGLTLGCTGCPQSIDARHPACPWCGKPAPDPLIAVVEFIMPGMPQPAPAGEALAVPPEGWLPITARTAHINPKEYDTSAVAWLWWQAAGTLVVHNPGPAPLWLTPESDPSNVAVLEPSDQLPLPCEGPVPRWILRFGPPGEPHRSIRIVRLRRGRGKP